MVYALLPRARWFNIDHKLSFFFP
ncbi:tryptophanase leader peptide [Neisseria sp.]